MEDELRCPCCKELFTEPVLLPCWHALCLGCAIGLQGPPDSPPESTTDSANAPNISDQEADKLSILSETDSGVVCSTSSRPGSYVGTPGNGGIVAAAAAAAAAASTSASAAAVVVSTTSVTATTTVTVTVATTTTTTITTNTNTNTNNTATATITTTSPTPTPNNSSSSNNNNNNNNNYYFNNGSGVTNITTVVLSLSCPLCHKTVYFDDGGARNLPKYRAMRRIVEKYQESRSARLQCQICEGEPREAVVACEQCEVLYCESCRESCHPRRGPLAAHNLGPPRPLAAAASSGGLRASSADPAVSHLCHDHCGESLTLYCALCKTSICALCLRDRHAAHPHEVLPLAAACKAQKTELSQNLQQLSERARSTTEFIQRLKGMTDKVHEECAALEEEVEDRVGKLIALLEARKSRLIEAARQRREAKVRSLREQVARCASHLQATTALLTFCIEALKETDNAAFLQIGGMLAMRAANAAGSWSTGPEAPQEIARLPLIDLTLDDKPLRRAIDQLTFLQLKPPGPPILIPEECSAENNSVTVAWQPPAGHGCPGQRAAPVIEGYLLELDDGCAGEFREVYCGRETICTVDGLHFNSLYNARVRAFNSAGEGEYSELIGLQTAEVAWFAWSRGTPAMPQEVSISEDRMSASCEGYEHRVVLANVGFSRGVHYWELTIDKYHSDTDPAFGIARADVARDQMLGKDDKGWSMYIDRQRSWFMHGGVHAQRTEGGVQQGSTVGVLLDLDTSHTVRFFVNDQPQGAVAFRDLYGVFYPAVSLNRGVTVSLHTALDVPPHLFSLHQEYIRDVLQS